MFGKQKYQTKNSVCLKMILQSGFGSAMFTSSFILLFFVKISFAKPHYLAAGEETRGAGARKVCERAVQTPVWSLKRRLYIKQKKSAKAEEILLLH